MVSADESYLGILPSYIGELQRFQLRKLKACATQHGTCFRACDRDGLHAIAEVRDLNVIHDDVAIEDGEKFFQFGVIGVESQGFAAIVGVHIAQNVALRIEQKGVNAPAYSQVPNIVGDHAIQPAQPVAASQCNFGAVEIKKTAAGHQFRELRGHVSEVGSGRDGVAVNG